MKKILFSLLTVLLLIVAVYLSPRASQQLQSNSTQEHLCFSDQDISRNTSEIQAVKQELQKMEKSPCSTENGSTAPLPTQFLIGGKTEYTVRTGETFPIMSWSSKNGKKFRTYITISDAQKCVGIKNNQPWTNGGKTASGKYKFASKYKAAAKMEGCTLTYNYEVTDKRGKVETARAKLKYVGQEYACYTAQEIQNQRIALEKIQATGKDMESKKCSQLYTCINTESEQGDIKHYQFQLVDASGKSINHTGIGFGQTDPKKGKIEAQYSENEITFSTEIYLNNTRFPCPHVQIPFSEDIEAVPSCSDVFLGGQENIDGKIYTCTGTNSLSIEAYVAQTPVSPKIGYLSSDILGGWEEVEIPRCGNNICDDGETRETCPNDCPNLEVNYCGDGKCSGDENNETCPEDCQPEKYCGDMMCSSEIGEDQYFCPADCGMPPLETCGNNTIDQGEECEQKIDGNFCDTSCKWVRCDNGLIKINHPTCECPKGYKLENNECVPKFGERLKKSLKLNFENPLGPRPGKSGDPYIGFSAGTYF